MAEAPGPNLPDLNQPQPACCREEVRDRHHGRAWGTRNAMIQYVRTLEGALRKDTKKKPDRKTHLEEPVRLTHFAHAPFIWFRLKQRRTDKTTVQNLLSKRPMMPKAFLMPCLGGKKQADNFTNDVLHANTCNTESHVKSQWHLESLHESLLRGHAHRGLPLAVHRLARSSAEPGCSRGHQRSPVKMQTFVGYLEAQLKPSNSRQPFAAKTGSDKGEGGDCGAAIMLVIGLSVQRPSKTKDTSEQGKKSIYKQADRLRLGGTA